MSAEILVAPSPERAMSENLPRAESDGCNSGFTMTKRLPERFFLSRTQNRVSAMNELKKALVSTFFSGSRNLREGEDRNNASKDISLSLNSAIALFFIFFNGISKRLTSFDGKAFFNTFLLRELFSDKKISGIIPSGTLGKTGFFSYYIRHGNKNSCENKKFFFTNRIFCCTL
ncbi:MAG: hypothetical protein IJD97_10635 [Clostridia bacterium]|nr:hypothetical protein [Clostridia bacterium]